MKTVLCAFNSSYSHTLLAARCLRSYAKKMGFDCGIREFTVNNETERAVSELCGEKADIYAFPVYIFNVNVVRSVARRIKLIFPDSLIVYGGPEVSYGGDFPEADFILCGEGEKVFVNFLSAGGDKEKLCDAKGIKYVYEGKEVFNGFEEYADIDDLPFPYDDLPEVAERILYYESSRGCPFRCSYCLSASEKSVRHRSLPLVFEDISRFIASGAEQVKFIDRTFNDDAERALSIWKYIAENDNGKISFHFEIAPWLLKDNQFEFLKTVREGLFRFEIGLQSSNYPTLCAVSRPISFEKSAEKIRRLRETPVHVHLDLIAGLPEEDYKTFLRSFDDAFSLGCDVLQLGFLKLLRGSPMEKSREAVHAPDAPYEILYNKWISFDELSKLKKISELVDIYYNSGFASFIKNTPELLGISYSDFFCRFSEFLEKRDFFFRPHRQIALLEYLFSFLSTFFDKNLSEYLCARIFYRIGKPGSYPEWLKSLPSKDFIPPVISGDEYLDTEKSVRKNSIKVVYPYNNECIIYSYGKKIHENSEFTNISHKKYLTNEK